MKHFWDERYAENKYAYGKEGNVFLKEELQKLNAKSILLPADGQGRNACMAALLGLDVIAFDYSQSGKESAEALANELNVKINFECCAAEDFKSDQQFDVVALIYAHLPERATFHQNMLQFLKPSGTNILEAFSKNQLGKNSGGPKVAPMLFSKEELASDFAACSKLEITETETVLNEGQYHAGVASVIRLVGTK
jgi:2-polyprenyl-3-methyl-5-hydroxy-6-metoxy-1,4-benzoquinol methylase